MKKLRHLIAKSAIVVLLVSSIIYGFAPMSFAAAPQLQTSGPTEAQADVPINVSPWAVFDQYLWTSGDDAPHWDAVTGGNVFLCKGNLNANEHCFGQDDTIEIPITVSILSASPGVNNNILVNPVSDLEASTQYTLSLLDIYTNGESSGNGDNSYSGVIHFTTGTAVCGDSQVGTGETCDDGNATAGDGCSDMCAIETGWTCSGTPSVCSTICGDSIIAGTEQCDDGNTAAGDGCSATCQIETQQSVCGNGQMEQGETCDDGNTTAGDGCSATCQMEPMTGGVSSVVGADADTTFYGLDGDDFTITWTPNQSAPSGYIGTMIFVLPNSVSVDSTNVMTTACSGAACEPVGFFAQYTQESHMLPPFMEKDSAGTAWNASTDYKACVLTQATVTYLDCSAAFNVTSDIVADTMSPFIEHMPLHTAITNQAVIIHSFIDDDQAEAADFTDAQKTAIAKMHHGTGFATEVNAAAVSAVDGLFTFTTGSAITDPTFDYFLSAQDNAATPNVSVFTHDPVATLANASSSPITAQVVTAGSRAISGSVKDFSGNAIENAYVFLGGYGKAGVLTNSSGFYNFNNIPDGAYDVIAAKTNYCRAMRFEIVSGDLSNIDLQLNEGTCQFFGPTAGPDGGGGTPFMVFSNPPEGFSNVPPNETIRAGFSQPLNPQTVNDIDSSATTDNIHLIGPDGQAVAGAVTYCVDKTSAGCSSLFDMDFNVILFQPDSDLTAGPHTLVITGAVTSESGQSIEGNRPGGGYNLNFNVGSGEYATNDINTNFGDMGQYMPPYVMSMLPSPFQGTVPPNTAILLEFNESMQLSTLTTSNIKLIKTATGSPQTISISADSNTQKTVTITPSANLASGEYELQVLADVANINGIPMMDPGRPNASSSDIAFSSPFEVGGTADTQAPNIYPFVAASAVDVPVNIGELEFG